MVVFAKHLTSPKILLGQTLIQKFYIKLFTKLGSTLVGVGKCSIIRFYQYNRLHLIICFILYLVILHVKTFFLYILYNLGFAMHFILGYFNMYVKTLTIQSWMGLCSVLQGLDCCGMSCLAYGQLHTDFASIRCKYVQHFEKTSQYNKQIGLI